MSTDPIRNVVILGGGTSGWMSAALLSRLLPAHQVKITLVESETIGTIGVGEATIPTIQTFNSILGIDEADFMRKTRATIKLGIEFTDWGRVGDSYIHPFGVYGMDRPEVKFHHMWLRMQALCKDVGSISDYNLTLVAARENRFGRLKSNSSLSSALRNAYHLDASLYARYLRSYSEARGVERVEGLVVKVEQRDDGFVTTLNLKDGRKVDGDLFLDCSGFRGALIEDALRVGYEDWTHWLPCDRAVAQPCENAAKLLPYTRSMADDFGWRWRIPLQHRIGNGYVYSSAHLDDDKAAARLLDTLDGRALADPLFVRFKAGCRRKFWDKNVVAIGLAGGFIEPLESTSIHLVQSGLTKLMQLFPDKNCSPVLRDEFNKSSQLEYEQIRDFIILHYKATERQDTAFWQRCYDMEVPDSLKHKIELFRDSGRIIRFKDDLFAEDSWLAVMMGQGVVPTRYDPVADTIAAQEMKAALLSLRTAISNVAQSLPDHAEFIHSFCAAD